MQKINRILVIGLLLGALLYTRFVNLEWGLPYPFHPDERNMATALQQLKCEVSSFKFQVSSFQDCFNPHFFAYGQLPLYLGYLFLQVHHFLIGRFGSPITMDEATLALRVISALLSILTAYLGVRIIEFLKGEGRSGRLDKDVRRGRKSHTSSFITPASYITLLTSSLLFIFSPALIQFAHFGTTESLLMFFYTAIVYFSLKWLENIDVFRSTLYVSLLSGLAIATKISSLIFLIVPATALLMRFTKFARPSKLGRYILTGFLIVFIAGLVAIIFSPHNLISFKDFIGAFRYESEVALGQYIPFYTRQFVDSIPVIFQLLRVFPFALGLPIFLFSVLGFLLLPWDRKNNFLRFAFLVYFLPTSMIFAKWTRFMAPVIPLMIIFASLVLIKFHEAVQNTLKNKYLKSFIHYLLFLILVIGIIPGVAYLSIYHRPDARAQASEWIYKNIPENSYILSETANVVDIPFPTNNKKIKAKNYQIISFDFYNLDEDSKLQGELEEYLRRADYIFVPSRRIWANHACPLIQNSKFKIQNYSLKCKILEQKYPRLNDYYQSLFSGRLGFIKVVEFSSFPELSFFNFHFSFADEGAEETWTVFDHPVVRIYKRTKPSS